ncbi:hypothetical protein KCP71_19745 [Salmonella enterica subsp. enterica]|nr:hypothetical protein KCP71_19745 [Salmonella enterica subsp. enterica]
MNRGYSEQALACRLDELAKYTIQIAASDSGNEPAHPAVQCHVVHLFIVIDRGILCCWRFHTA